MPEADETVVEYVRRGDLLPTELLFDVLRPHVNAGGTIILDGFPRRLDQAEAFEREVTLVSLS
jgi:UMP-CMP kinase